MDPRRHPLRLPLLLAGVIVVVFLPVLGHEFVSYDDGINIVHNWRVTQFSWANLLYFWRGSYDNLYIPLTYNLWALLDMAADLCAGGRCSPLSDQKVFHAANLLLHMGCGLVVFAILRRLVANGWAAWAGALLFAVHPVQVESVAWVTGMKDVFSAFWALVAIWQYLLYCAYAVEGRTGRRAYIHYALMGFCFGLAILAKPGVVIVPLLLLVLGRLWLRRGWRLVALEITPLLLMTLPVIIMTKGAQPDSSQAWQPELWQRLLVAGDALGFYAYQVLAPHTLGPDYGRTPRFVLDQHWVYLTALPVLALLVARCLWRRAGRLLVAADIFVVSLLPVLGLVSFDFQNISTVADRYLYLAMLGPGLAIAWALARWRTWRAWGVILVVIVVLAGKTMVQSAHWQDSSTLTAHALTVNPRSWVMNNNQGLAMAQAEHYEEAIAAFERALAANPDYGEAYNNLGALYRQLLQNSDAMENFKKALAINPANAKAAFSLAILHRVRHQPLQAIDYYRQAIAAKPDFLEAYNNLGLIYLELNRSHAAMEVYQQALLSCQDHPQLRYNLARTYAELGRQQESIAELRRAVAVDPSFALAYHQLYHSLRAVGEEAAARGYLARAVELGFAVDSCGACRESGAFPGRMGKPL
jgi:tetratricopeptide (TPR) repeat protein